MTSVSPVIWLGRQDSNLRMPESKSGALTNLATAHSKEVRILTKRSAFAKARARIFADFSPFRRRTNLTG